ncbi:DNA polymerase processivity factor [Cotia virus SPAn232]|uniref:DNA polymerase processivity factor n=2 Tax=Cotia virus TaxID=39444 RepID=H6TAA0_9POXV|nr:DNA polymerase processivity factor [Cotia virus SPAn232]ADT91139.1 DNA polymerase processivity factor [Cotia virus SPAn232]AIT70745.1 DNA polymerase processivity factor [Cotia virus]
MTKNNNDINNLTELLLLKDCINFTDKKTRDRYNQLIDWATYKYWKIEICKIVTDDVSISAHYSETYLKPFKIKSGRYIFLPMCFGNIYIYVNGTMMELGSGNIKKIDKTIKEQYDNILNTFKIDFIRFIYFRGKWIIDDVFSKYESYTEIINYISNKKINIVPYINIKILEDRIFTNDDYNILELYFLKLLGKFYPSALCFIPENSYKRNIIDFYNKTYVHIKSIELESIGDNIYMPKLITKSGYDIIIRDIYHLIDSAVTVKSFAVVKKKNNFVLLDSINKCNYSKSEYLYNMMRNDIGSDFFIKDKYLSKVYDDIGIKFLSKKLGIDNDCYTLNNFIKEINNNNNVKVRIISTSSFELIRECLEYPKTDFISLVNNMIFDIEDGKVKDFNLENLNCLEDPNISVIYGNFNNFVYLFNIIVDAKRKISSS